MTLKENLKSGWNTVKENVINYLLTTTIHGLRYLYDGRNWVEKIVWLIIILGCFTGCFNLISQSLDEAAKEPILTTIETTEVQNVPFPAITIGGDANVNEWGFVEKFFNFLAFYNTNSKVICLIYCLELSILVNGNYFQYYDAQIYEKSKALRKHFSFIFEAIRDAMREELMIQKKDMNLTELKLYGKGTSDINFIRHNFKKLSETAMNLATFPLQTQLCIIKQLMKLRMNLQMTSSSMQVF